MVLFKRRNLQNIRKRNADLKLSTTEKEASSCADQPLYATVVQKEAPPSVPSKSEELVEHLDKDSAFTAEVPTQLIPADSEYTGLPSSPSRMSPKLSNPEFEEMESNPMYQNNDQHHDPHTYTNMAQENISNVIYTTPDIVSSQTVETYRGNFDVEYSEPIQPSLLTGAAGSPSEPEDLHPYCTIYTVPPALPKSDKMPLKVFASNIEENCELGKGLYGEVILAETVGLSPKDLRVSELDDDKSKSTLVAVKTLKSGASSTTKEAFEKEVNYMSRLNDKNVIRILGVCYEDTPFIRLEYMKKGDLNH